MNPSEEFDQLVSRNPIWAQLTGEVKRIRTLLAMNFTREERDRCKSSYNTIFSEMLPISSSIEKETGLDSMQKANGESDQTNSLPSKLPSFKLKEYKTDTALQSKRAHIRHDNPKGALQSKFIDKIPIPSNCNKEEFLKGEGAILSPKG